MVPAPTLIQISIGKQQQNLPTVKFEDEDEVPDLEDIVCTVNDDNDDNDDEVPGLGYIDDHDDNEEYHAYTNNKGITGVTS